MAQCLRIARKGQKIWSAGNGLPTQIFNYQKLQSHIQMEFNTTSKGGNKLFWGNLQNGNQSLSLPGKLSHNQSSHCEQSNHGQIYDNNDNLQDLLGDTVGEMSLNNSTQPNLLNIVNLMSKHNFPILAHNLYMSYRGNDKNFNGIYTTTIFDLLLEKNELILAMDIYTDLRDHNCITSSKIALYLSKLVNSSNISLSLQVLKDLPPFYTLDSNIYMKLIQLCLDNNDLGYIVELYENRAYYQQLMTVDLANIMINLEQNSSADILRYFNDIYSCQENLPLFIYENTINNLLNHDDVVSIIDVYEKLSPNDILSQSCIESIFLHLIDGKEVDYIVYFLRKLYTSGQILEHSLYKQLADILINHHSIVNLYYDSININPYLPSQLYELVLYCSCTNELYDYSYRLFNQIICLKNISLPKVYYSMIHSSIKLQKWDIVQLLLMQYNEYGGQYNLLPWEETISNCKKIDKALIYYNRLKEYHIIPSVEIYKILFSLCLSSKQVSTLSQIIEHWFLYSQKGDSQLYSLVLQYAIDYNDQKINIYYDYLLKSSKSCERTITLLNYYKLSNDLIIIRSLLYENISDKYNINQFNIILEACKLIQDSDLGLIYYDLFNKNDYLPTKNIISLVFSFYKTSPNWEKSLEFFEKRKKIDGISNHLYFSMLGICKIFNNYEYAKKLVYELIENDIKPSNSIQNSVLSLFRDLKKYDEADKLYAILKQYQKIAPVVHGCMINIYGDQQKFKEAFDLYENIKNEDEIGNSTYCAVFHNCAKLCDMERADTIFNDFKSKELEYNTHIYSSFMLVCKETNNISRICELIDDMKSRDIQPDNYVLEILNQLNIEY